MGRGKRITSRVRASTNVGLAYLQFAIHDISYALARSWNTIGVVAAIYQARLHTMNSAHHFTAPRHDALQTANSFTPAQEAVETAQARRGSYGLKQGPSGE